MTVAWIKSQLEQSAKDVLSMAATGGMPDSYWTTDQRIQRACHVLGWSATTAQMWAENAAEYE